MSSFTIEPRALTRLILAFTVILAIGSSAEAQQQVYYQAEAAPGTVAAPTYVFPTTLYQAVQSVVPQIYQPAAQPVQYVQQPAVEPQTYQAGPAEAAPAAQPAAAPASSWGDPYGFTAWLNGIRASYGLGAVSYDPNLSNWAAMNNDQQAARGLGHHVMGPARFQNSAMGGFPGVESMWMASPAHRAALLDPTISFIGIAGAGAWWTFNAN